MNMKELGTELEIKKEDLSRKSNHYRKQVIYNLAVSSIFTANTILNVSFALKGRRTLFHAVSSGICLLAGYLRAKKALDYSKKKQEVDYELNKCEQYSNEIGVFNNKQLKKTR